MVYDELVCKRCGVLAVPHVEEIPLARGGYHLKASCASCGGYIKFLPQGGSPKLHFGKHKGKDIELVAMEDPEYLKWLMAQEWLKRNLRTAIEEAMR